MQRDHGTPGDGLSGTGHLEALADGTRRRTIAVLAAAESSLSLFDLAMELARTDRPGAETRSEVRRLQVRLYHCHLPKLDAAGLVEFDHEDRRVRLAEDLVPDEIPVALQHP